MLVLMLGIGSLQAMRITGNVFNLLVMVNCAANFILYSALSTKFRATFSRLFCACATSSPDSSCRRRCCCVHTYSSAARRDVNPDHTTVTGHYASLPAARPGGRRHGGRSTASTTVVGDSDNEAVCSVRQTTTTDKLIMPSPSPIEEDLDDLHITTL